MSATIGRILLIPKGDYSGSTVYNSLDWVRYDSKAWVCKVDGTVGVVPAEGDNWTVMAQDGSVSGAVNWSAVNNKPFDDIDPTEFEKNGSGNLVLKNPNNFGTIKVDTHLLYASCANDTIEFVAGNNVTITTDNVSNPNKITIESTGGGGGSSTFAGLSDVSLSGSPTAGQIVQYTDVSGQIKLRNVAMPTGGHTMIPSPDASVDEDDVVNAVNGALLEGGTNDDVISAYGAGVWSNVKEYTLKAHVDAGDDTVGVWNDGWESENPKVRTGWIYHECLYHMLSNDDIKYEIDFDVAGGESVGWYAHRIDDEVTITVTEGGQSVTKNVGCIAIKLLNPVQTVGGIDVAVDVRINRTETVNNVVPAPTP